jgi:Domain of unknown function (DUF5134)
VIATLPLAVVLSAVFAASGVLTLVCAPDPVRPAARLARPAMSASMLVMTWTSVGALALSWPAILVTGCSALGAARRTGSDACAHAATAAASVWMLVAMPASAPRLTTLGVCAVLVAASAFWTVRALPGRILRADAGGQALMGLGMIAMLLAMLAGW